MNPLYSPVVIAEKQPQRGRLSHVKHIPGGKRFWKVGGIYRLNVAVAIASAKIELVEANRKRHRRTNDRWRGVANDLIDYPNNRVSFTRLDKGYIFILLGKPDYKTIIGTNNPPHDICEAYQIKVLCNEKIGWIQLDKNISPRYYCSPVK